jgi:hypothetical protein
VTTTHNPAAAGNASGKPNGVLITVLLVVTTVLAVLAMLAIWANRELLNPVNWASTSRQLMQNAQVRTATANYLVDQLSDSLNVSGVIRSDVPAVLQSFAGGAAGELRKAAASGIERALARPDVQTAWAAANRVAAQTFVNIVEGHSRAVSVSGGEVTLNLRPVLEGVSARLSLPVDLGAQLPASAAQLRILRSDQLSLVRKGGNALRGLALVLAIVVPVLYLLVIAIARGRRRRTLMWVGVSLIVAGAAVLLVRLIAVAAVPSSLVKDASLRPAAGEVVSIATTMLVLIAVAVMVAGAVIAVVAWFAGSRFVRSRPAPRSVASARS